MEWVQGLRQVLRNPNLDPAFKELVLTLPSETFIAEQLDQVDPQRIHQVRERMRHQLAHDLQEIEAQSGWTQGALRILPLVETCLGLRNTYDLGRASERVCGMSLASAEQGDFMVDLGGRWTPSSMALAYPRSKMVVDARAAGLPWLVDGVFMNLKDTQALRTECLLARELGFVGKMAIHPTQVEVMHEVFSPSEEEIRHARGLLQAFRAAEAQGIGAVRYEGMMVDYANVRLAERTLSLVQDL